MKVFLDTSSLIKLYHKEVDTVELEQIFSTVKNYKYISFRNFKNRIYFYYLEKSPY